MPNPNYTNESSPTTPIPHPSQAQAGPRSQNPRPSQSGQQSTRGGSIDPVVQSASEGE
ncbi:hypothetical protein PGT21_002669 [Puccinia graminis f. sp. tritici]|uniref:Uncharacterized protein n=1 Tax=Puccinia graminis f. sp. tritici TaxID=56615 RepID=A0A5B0N0V8_PUCGR|nr:hypothetical protein PGT21_002669 [Puccinia graminis f. sp. tritici]KAA1133685.1 hypothetical protein PGTUg99_031340 [Puccinia graminis f. sp. tritici]